VKRPQSGAASVEFALAATLFLTLMFAVVDFAQLFWVNLTMQHAVREGARYAVTGRTDGLDPSYKGSSTDRCGAATEMIREQSMGLFDQLSAQVTFKSVADDGTITPIASGACYSAGKIIVVQVDSSAHLLTPFMIPVFPDGVYNFTVSTTMKNEDYK
jgi:Flp pilus assembly protein TadG